MRNKISVIIPIYNAEKYLRKCVDSIIRQTYSNLEIILINDGSTDESEKICIEYQNNDKRIKLLTKENEGVSSARNAGLSIATGDYITFIDSDDWISDSSFEDAINVINEHNVDILKYSYIKDYGFMKKTYKFSIKTNEKIIEENYSKEIYPYVFSTYDLSNIWNAIYKRDILKNLKFNNSIKYGEDYLFMMNALLNSKSIFFLDKPNYHYYNNYSSATNIISYQKFIKNIEDIIVVNQNIYQLVAQNDGIEIKMKYDKIAHEYELISKQIVQHYKYHEYNKIKNEFSNIINKLEPELIHRINKINNNYFKYKIIGTIKLVLKFIVKSVEKI